MQVATFPSVHPRAHLVVRLKGTRADVGVHQVVLSWKNPQGAELWNSNGQLDIGAPPPQVTEIDMPLIAPIDLPLDGPGSLHDDDHTGPGAAGRTAAPCAGCGDATRGGDAELGIRTA